MVTFIIDDNAFDIINEWKDDYYDLAVRFCDDISPRFTSARIIYQGNDKKPLEIRYSVDLNKVAFIYIPSRDSLSVRFRIFRSDNPLYNCIIQSHFEYVASFYVNVARLFVYLNAFVLNDELSSSAKKAMEKKTLLDFKKHTYFTVRSKNCRAYLDTCNVLQENDRYIIT